MGRKAGIELDDVVDVAVAIADRDGLEAATLSAVARELGIKTPSLYNHVSGREGLRRQLTIRGARILLEDLQAAIDERTGSDALRIVARVDREFALAHPGLYEAFLPAPRPEEDPELYEIMAEPVSAIARVLLEMGISQDEAIHLIRAFRATIHGFLDLEAKDGFGMPLDIDESFDAAVELMIAGIEAVVRSQKG
ncbi:MAG: TetR-like C-terminal domain-containing protein [Acidimicrobiia bacterium]|jgi:AcrR family transcriptional regulator